MVQGLPAVDWKKPENNAKLFAAVLATIPGTPNHKQIAKVFGEFILVLCLEFCYATTAELRLLDSNPAIP